MYMIHFRLLLVGIFWLLITSTAAAQIHHAQAFDKGAVVAAEQLAAQTGAEILRKGGNAIDAAVAVNFALAVTYPQAGNIGGGGFMVLHLQDGSNHTLDFRETAPRKAKKNMFLDRKGNYDPQKARKSALASGVPGTVEGMLSALERYGNLPLDIVLEPAIELASKGYELTRYQASILNEHAEQFARYESSAAYFTKPDGEPFEAGERFVQKDLAETLRRISRFGRNGFYSGITADMMVETMEQYDGIIDYIDLTKYKSKWREPVTHTFQDYELVMMPPPSSGGVTIKEILKMIEPYDPGKMAYHSADYIHLLSEAMRRAFADRNYYLGDPDFERIPNQILTADFYANERMASFAMDTLTSSDSISHGNIPNWSESVNTTHFSVVDRYNNMVSVTTTLNSWFGNHIAVEGAGFLLNNEMDDFAAKPGEPNQFGLVQGEVNAIEPGKRMLSSMVPTIVTRSGRPAMVLGAAGGPRIITTVLQHFLNVALFSMNAQQAVSAPRFHHQWLPDQISYEPFGFSPETQKALTRKGHRLVEAGNLSRAHILVIDREGVIHAGVDPRGNGAAAGH